MGADRDWVSIMASHPFERADPRLQGELVGLYFWDDFFEGTDDPRQSCPGDFLGRLRAAFGPMDANADGLVLRNVSGDEMVAARYTAHGGVLFGRRCDTFDASTCESLRGRLQRIGTEMRRLDEDGVDRRDQRHVDLLEEMREARLRLCDEEAGSKNAHIIRALVNLLLATEPVAWEGILELRIYDEPYGRPTGRVRIGWKDGDDIFQFLPEGA